MGMIKRCAGAYGLSRKALSRSVAPPAGGKWVNI
jgi:hypothetical protein